jgi:hypothetical protein
MVTTMTKSSPYPEHDKLHGIKDRSQVLGELLDTSDYVLAEYVHVMVDDDDQILFVKCDNEGCIGQGHQDVLVPVRKNVTQLLAEFFQIDLNVLEDEKRAMLDELRAANAQRKDAT